MSKEAPSPVDLPEPEGRPALGWTAAAMAVACLLLLLMNAVSLSDWIEDQPPGPLQAGAAAMADRWVEIADGIGLGRPRRLLHEEWKRAEAARFPEVQR